MADKRFSQFTDGNEIRIGDKVVGLRSGVNYGFNFPSDGIKDSTGNYIYKYSTVGGAVNHIKLSNNITANAPILEADGADADIGLVIRTKGTGEVSIPDDVVDLTKLKVDNLELNANSIISTDTAGDINITPDTTGDLVLDGLKWPQADGTSGQGLITNGATQLSWADVTTITGTVLDNEVARFDGTSGDLQGSGIFIDDNANIKIPDSKGLIDGNDNELLIFNETVSAVNYIQFTNQATGSGPSIDAVGDDVTVDLNISSKGASSINLSTDSTNRADINNSGLRLGAANSRVTTILDEDTMSSNSDTALATQQSIKAYVDSASSSGKVVQYSISTSSVNDTTTSTTYVASSLSGSITPTDSANIIFIQICANVNYFANASDIQRDGDLQIYRTSGTPLSLSSVSLGRELVTASSANAPSRMSLYLAASETAGSTAAHTYELQYKVDSSNVTAEIRGLSDGPVHMIIWELLP